MAIVTLDDVRMELPKLKLDPTTEPSDSNVTSMIAETQSEVQARLEACGMTWPPDGSAAADYLKRTVLEGVRWLVLRAKYTFSSSQGQSLDIDRAYKAYMDRLSSVCDVARAAQNVQDTQTGQPAFNRNPKVCRTDLQPNLSSSFATWTEAVDIVDSIRTAERWNGLRPWPLQ
jgi:hypothetical protein